MSFLKKLFGLGGGSSQPASLPERSEPYEGFEIRATPYEEEGKFQLCGVISREVDGVLREHRYVRADRFATIDDAIEMTLFKGRQIIDQTGDRLFLGAAD